MRKKLNNSIWLIPILFSICSCASLNSTNYQARIRALKKVTDQSILFKVAMTDPNYEVKIAAFNRITDPILIGKIALECKEPKLRLEATEIVKDQDILYKIALDDQENIRDAAMNRLLPDKLARLATDFKDLDLKLRAVELLTDQPELMNVSQNNEVWEVRKSAFRKLDDKSLDALSRDAKDPAIILSAKIRLGLISWNEAFSGKGGSIETLGNIIGAAAITDSPKPTSSDIVSACHNFIRLGDSSRIPELVYLLNAFGDKYLAEDYMNCGESTLEDAGCKWGRANGYNCTTGYGSNRVKWGSKK